MIVIQNGVPKLKFLFVTCLVCHSALAFVFMKNWVHHNQSPFLLLSEVNKTTEKSCFCQGLWLWKKYMDLLFLQEKPWRQQNHENLELIGIYFQKLSWCTTTEPNFLVVAYPSQSDGLRSTWTLKSPCLTLPVLTQDEQKT